MIDYAHPSHELNLQRLPQVHGPTNVLSDLGKALAKQPKVTTWLATAEGRAFRQKMERGPDLEPFVRD